MSQYKLTSEIIKLSKSQNWDAAKLEWAVEDIYYSDEDETCLCGHHPIKEICTINNKSTGNYAIVGNCCVKKFLGITYEKIFQSYKKIKRDSSKSINVETISFALNKAIINQWENDFYLDILRKRNLSEKQLKVKIKINNKIIKALSKK